MPLLMLCGLPSSGKSRRSRQLTEYFEGLGKKVLVVNEESLMLVRSEVYASGQAEKEARGAVKAAVERFVDQNTLVIADHMNAIKGFRYELYCRARSLKSLHCVVFCKTQAEICKAWNSERSEDQRYTDEQMDDLIGRFEEPVATRRWDNPLFVVTPDDELPLEEINQALFHGKAVKPSLATQVVEYKDTNYLYELDRVTKEVMKTISSAQSSGNVAVGDLVAVPYTDHMLLLSRSIGLSELKRIHAQFVKIAKSNPPAQADPKSIAGSFVDYINSTIMN